MQADSVVMKAAAVMRSAAVAGGATPVLETEAWQAVSADPITVTKPTGTVSGDFLLAFVSADGSGNTFNFDNNASGFIWSTLAGFPSDMTLDGQSVALASRTAGASEPASYEFGTTAADTNGGIIRISGSSGIDVIGTITVNNSANACPATATCSGVTTTVPNCLLIGVVWTDTGATIITFTSPDLTMVESHIPTDIFNPLGVAQGEQVSAGATGDKDFTVGDISQNTAWTTVLIAIKPI